MPRNTHTPGPWKMEDVAGAGLQIHAPVNLCTFVELPLGMPPVIFTFNMSQPAVVSIAHERWVQFEPKGWHEMQLANAQLIAASPDLLAVLRSLTEKYETGNLCLEDFDEAKAAIAKAERRHHAS